MEQERLLAQSAQACVNIETGLWAGSLWPSSRAKRPSLLPGEKVDMAPFVSGYNPIASPIATKDLIVACEYCQALTRFQIPDSQGMVERARDGVLAIFRQRDSIDTTRMTVKNERWLNAYQIPDSHIVVVAIKIVRIS